MKAPLLLIFYFYAIKLFAQEPYNYQLNVDDGLPSSIVYNIFQDSKKIIWIATEEGICRYDGTVFKRYNNANLNGKACTGLSEDWLGRIWFYNFYKQICFIENDSLKIFQSPKELEKISFPNFKIDNSNKSLWTKTSNSLLQYNFTTNEWATFTPPFLNKVEDNITSEIYFDADDNIWMFFTNSGLVKFNLKIKSWTQFTARQLKQFQKNNSFKTVSHNQSLLKYITGKIYYHINGSFGCIKKDSLEKLSIPLYYSIQNKLNSFAAGKQNEVWLLTSNGAWEINNKTSKTLLLNNNISSLIVDKEGNYWLGTLGNGVFVFPSMDILVYTNKNSQLLPIQIHLLKLDNQQNLWMGFNNATVQYLNTKDNRFNTYTYPDGGAVNAIVPNFSNESFLVGTSNIYINSKQGVAQHKLQGNSVKDLLQLTPYLYIRASAELLSLCLIPDAEKDEASKKWIHWAIVTAKKNKQPGSFDKTTFSLFKEKIIILEPVKTYKLLLDTISKTLYACHIEGLKKYNTTSSNFILDENGKNIIAQQCIQINDGSIFIATKQHGLYWVKGRKIIKHITTKEGLYSNEIRCIKSNKNTIWIGFDGAVQEYNYANKIFKTITILNGLVHTDVTALEIIGNDLYVAAGQNLQKFINCKTIERDAPDAMISNIKLFEKDISVSDNYSFSYKENNFKFYFTATGYANKHFFSFQYRMKGIDTNWISLTNSNFATYPYLKYGNYVFEVRALNAEEKPGKPAIIAFKVAAPFWLRWWFITLVGAIIISSVYFYYYKRIKQLNTKNKLAIEKIEIQELLRKSQLASLKSQMNPHFMFNALNSIQEFIILNDKEQANMYMGKFADLMRMTLDMSSKDEVSLVDELNCLNLYLELEGLRFEKQFSYEIIVDEKINPATIYVPPMLVQPYVENAVKHGLLHKQGEKELKIIFTLKDLQTLSCSITDNGIGRKRSQEINSIRQKKHTSFATGTTQNRLELLNLNRDKNLSVEYKNLDEENERGTIVTIHIPV